MGELERSFFCEEKFDRENLISQLVSAPNASFTLEELNAKSDKWSGRRVRKYIISAVAIERNLENIYNRCDHSL